MLKRIFHLIRQVFRTGGVLLVVLLSLGDFSLRPTSDPVERARIATRAVEFDFVSWIVEAFGVKLGQAVLGTEAYLSETARKQVVLDYLQLVVKIWQVEAQVAEFYADPGSSGLPIPDAQTASAAARAELDDLYTRRARLEPLAESILQSQIGAVLHEMGFTLAGQPIPPVLYRATSPPKALIISPRDHIEQIADISISPDLTVDASVALEEKIDLEQDVSSLVVGIGGIGVYPTMVMRTADINWLAEVVAHEWTHNYLTLRPLGANYMTSPDLRTMNETTASIAGKEIGRAVIARFYPELLPPPPDPTPETPATPIETVEPPAFSYHTEMRITRVEADRLLAEGKVEEAEAYMELRRHFFWDNGYRIRKINQAFFAFYGAYADAPGGGAAGADPVGEAVRTLRTQSGSLYEFIHRMAWFTSFEQLQHAVVNP